MKRPSQTSRVVVFEDQEKNFNDLKGHFVRHPVARDLKLERYTSGGEPSKSSKISNFLSTPERCALVILDDDLSEYNYHVSKAEVMDCSYELGIPYCVYSREFDENKVAELTSWKQCQVTLESTHEAPDVCLNVLRGFRRVQDSFGVKNSKKKSFKQLMVDLLGAPEASKVHVSQYGWGQVNLLASFAGKHDEAVRSNLIAYWIHNVLLRFPGVLLDEAAAASYLDIRQEQFSSNKIKKYFENARYTGPFSEMKDYWWTAELDRILSEKCEMDGRIPSGREYLRLKGLKMEVKRSRCVDGKHDGAGYYCILTNNPVCANDSVAPTGWLPLGADRSRICNTKYEELKPWFAI